MGTKPSRDGGLLALTPQQELEAWGMDPDHAAAVMKYRRVTIKAPLEEMGARLLGKAMSDAAAAGLVRDVNHAAEVMIERCWRGFKGEWLEPKSNQRYSAQHGESVVERRQRELVERVQHDHGIGRERGEHLAPHGYLPKPGDGRFH